MTTTLNIDQGPRTPHTAAHTANRTPPWVAMPKSRVASEAGLVLSRGTGHRTRRRTINVLGTHIGDRTRNAPHEGDACVDAQRDESSVARPRRADAELTPESPRQDPHADSQSTATHRHPQGNLPMLTSTHPPRERTARGRRGLPETTHDAREGEMLLECVPNIHSQIEGMCGVWHSTSQCDATAFQELCFPASVGALANPEYPQSNHTIWRLGFTSGVSTPWRASARRCTPCSSTSSQRRVDQRAPIHMPTALDGPQP